MLSNVLSRMLDPSAEVTDSDLPVNTPMCVDDESPAGFCIECRDQPRELHCDQCEDDYCKVCFDSLHRRGTRKLHRAHDSPSMHVDIGRLDDEVKASSSGIASDRCVSPEEDERVGNGIGVTMKFEAGWRGQDRAGGGDWMLERCKFIPLRLRLHERKYMRLVKNALDVSEYTDKVDILTYKSKVKRVQAELKELCGILTGLVMASNYEIGQELLQDKSFEDNAAFFQHVFELTRRHKIRNPEKLRDVYGKMVHVLMDAQSMQIQDIMGFSMVSPLQTVHSFFKENDALEILNQDHELIMSATEEINPAGKSRRVLDNELRARDAAFKKLVKKWTAYKPKLTADNLELCFRSIGDNHNYLRNNRDPVDRMLGYLTKYFPQKNADPARSLQIRAGHEGARLSHSHDQQYHYVLQSMTLWREIINEMFQLWYLAELDMFDEDNNYSLQNTGQGLNRVQSCPRVSRAMRSVVHRVHQRVGSWVGSSVIHLGDRAVPNALIFVDKYNQVSDILNPFDNVIRRIEELLDETPSLKPWVRDTFGSVEQLRIAILSDFFRHGFDGSGAENFYDAGSCIDGRLTSAWNWCQTISKKKFYPIFLLAGFSSFNGNW